MTLLQFLNVLLINLFAWVAFSYFWSYWTYKLFKPFNWLQALKSKKVSPLLKELEQLERDKAILYTLWFQSKRLQQDSIMGKVIHVGLDQGQRAKLIIELLPEREHQLFDFFEPTTPNGALQTETSKNNELVDNTNKLKISKLQQNIGLSRSANIHQGTLQEFTSSLSNPIAFIYLDLTRYEDLLAALNLLYPKLTKQGVLIITGYNNKWSGAIKAVDEFKKSIPEIFVSLVDAEGSILLIKNR